ncbi:MAG: hypoxanthine-guanine phosphoribosyltransferase [Wenzhouxiangellaceae bacterium]
MQAKQILEHSERLIDSAQVAAAVDQWALGIRQMIRTPDLVVLAVLRGGMIPATWLVSRLSQPLEMDCIHATRYHGGTSGGALEWVYRPTTELRGRPVLVVDDIYDEGHTMQAVVQWCREQDAASVHSAALVRKLHDRGRPRDEIDFFALDVPDVYVFGCGMDCYEHWRHLPAIYQFNEAAARDAAAPTE